MNIAILILAHKNFDQLRLLTDHLRTHFKVFVHVNRKVRLEFQNQENLTFIEERHIPYWGSDNTLKAMLALLRSARAAECDYFMFISGQDLPLMTNENIIRKIGDGRRNYIYFHQIPKDSWPLEGGLQRISLYWPKLRQHQSLPGRLFDFGLKSAFRLFQQLQLTFGLKRSIDFEPWGGSMWLNINLETCHYILNYVDENPEFLKRFSYTRLADEIFFQTILLGTGFSGRSSIECDDMRYIDWSTGPEYPRIFRSEDFNRCVNSGKFFGRKFDSSVDGKVIGDILNYLS